MTHLPPHAVGPLVPNPRPTEALRWRQPLADMQFACLADVKEAWSNQGVHGITQGHDGVERRPCLLKMGCGQRKRRVMVKGGGAAGVSGDDDTLGGEERAP